jgi:hypothetical protein
MNDFLHAVCKQRNHQLFTELRWRESLKRVLPKND